MELDNDEHRRVEDSARLLPDSILRRVCINPFYYGKIKTTEDKWLSMVDSYSKTDSRLQFTKVDAESREALRHWARANAEYMCDPAVIHSRYAYRPVSYRNFPDTTNRIAKYLNYHRVRISHIGYNADSTKAVLMIEVAGSCMLGQFWYLEKECGDWFVFARGSW